MNTPGGRCPLAPPPAPAYAASQPLQGVPLQRARVLELVDQQVRDARVEPLLHPARELAVAQQRERDALEVGHVGQALRALVFGERGEQRVAEASHAQVLFERLVLMNLGGEMLERFLQLLDQRQAATQRTRLVLGREENRPRGIEAIAWRERQRGRELFAGVAGQLAARPDQLAHRVLQSIGPRRRRDDL